jgi:hypothetical protein
MPAGVGEKIARWQTDSRPEEPLLEDTTNVYGRPRLQIVVEAKQFL